MQSRLEQLLEFLKESPHDPFIHYAIASEHLKAGQQDQALAGFEGMIINFPDYVGTYYHLGKLYESLGDLQQAIQTYQKGMEKAKAAGNSHAFGELQAALQWILLNEED